MKSEERGRIEDALARRAGGGQSAVLIAEAVTSAWCETHASLSPVIGQRGADALLRRSLHLSVAAHPWLLAATRSDKPGIAPDTLRSALTQQSAEEAAAGGGLLLQTLNDLLVTLIGPSLTERLLGSAWQPFFGESPSQDHFS